MRPEIISYDEDLPIKISVNHIIEHPLHWHDAIEIIYVLEGSVNLSISYEEFLLKENDIAILNIDDVHSLHETTEENKILFFHIDRKFFQKYYKDFKYIFFVPYISRGKKKNIGKIDMLLKYVGEIVWEFNERIEGYPLQIDGTLKHLLFFLVNHFEYVRFEADNLKISEIQIERYQRLATFLFKNYMNKISLQEFADEEHLSMYYLSHYIKDNTGYSFQELVNSIRADVSILLLLGTDKTISEISLECGFSDSKYFNKYFKRYFNSSPSEFRKKHKIENHKLQEMKKVEEFHISTSLEKLAPYIVKNKRQKEYTNNKVEMLSIDISSKSKGFYPYWKDCICLSSAKYTLAASYQNYLKEIQKDIGFKYIRVFRIFDDEMEVYNEDKEGNSVYYWHYVDETLKFLLKVNIKPIIHFGPMSVPPHKYSELINIFLSHYIKEYGLKEIETWQFEICKNIDSNIIEEIIAVIKSFSSKIKLQSVKNPESVTNFLLDTIFMAPYLAHTAIHTRKTLPFIQVVDSIDYDGQSKIYNHVFFGGNGLISSYGLKKASYYTCYLLSQLGNRLINKGNGHIVTRKEENIQILLYNHDDIYTNSDISTNQKVSKLTFFKTNQGKEIIVNITNLTGAYKVTRYELNEKHGSSFDHWISMGEPTQLSYAEQELINRIAFPKVSFNYINKSNINLTVQLPPHGVELITLEKTK